MTAASQSIRPHEAARAAGAGDAPEPPQCKELYVTPSVASVRVHQHPQNKFSHMRALVTVDSSPREGAKKEKSRQFQNMTFMYYSPPRSDFTALSLISSNELCGAHETTPRLRV